MLRIGTAQADITPAYPFQMGFTFVKIQCRKQLDPLMASCVVADDGGTRVAMVSCDLDSISRDLVLAIRERVTAATGTQAENIHVMTTHNHAAPTIFPKRDMPFAGEDEIPGIEKTRAGLVEDIAACVIAAHKNPVPARMGYGRGRFDGGAFNRRFIMHNGRSRMHGGGNLERLQPEGPVDPEVQAVWFEDAEGRALAVMVNYASHATNLYGGDAVSADFPGVMRGVLQSVLGTHMPVLYLQGCCGNVMCDDLSNPNRPKKIENALRIGRSLAGEVLRIMGDHQVGTAEAGVSTARRLLEIPYRDSPPMPFDAAREQWDHYQHHWDDFRRLDIEERAAIGSTLRLAGYRREGAAEAVELSAVALGDVCLVTNPAELFVEYQLEIKQRFPTRKVILTEQTDGRIGYVPTRLACALGGYEAIQTRFNPDAGERIRDASCELIENLNAGPAAATEKDPTT